VRHTSDLETALMALRLLGTKWMDSSSPWPVLEHEIRGTVGAIVGLVRLLGDERVTSEDRERVLASLGNATERASRLASDVGQMTRWTGGLAGERRQSVRLPHLLEQALTRARDDGMVTIEPDPSPANVAVPVFDAEALVSALAACARAARRASGDGLACRTRSVDSQVEVLLAPCAVDWLADEQRQPFDVSRSGLGLAPLVAATVIEAHQGCVRQDASGAVISVRLPITGAR
jgi:K+-sensing histidine kinase KdpD